MVNRQKENNTDRFVACAHKHRFQFRRLLTLSGSERQQQQQQTKETDDPSEPVISGMKVAAKHHLLVCILYTQTDTLNFTYQNEIISRQPSE